MADSWIIISSLAGVREDVADIVLNVKQTALKVEGEVPKRLTLAKTSPGLIQKKEQGLPKGRPFSMSFAMSRQTIEGGPMTYALTPQQLDAYLARIGVARPAQADPAALGEIHRAHALGFTWEAIDCFMGWPVSIEPQAAWAKAVAGRRGGWCYELNGLLGAALSALGFEVTRLCGGVRREDVGDDMVGNHLTLRIDFSDGPWLAETGLGDALVDPIPLRPGGTSQRGYAFAIERADGDWLRFRNHAHGGAPSFDFRTDYVDEGRLAGAHDWLRGAEQSPFANNLVVQRHFPDRIESVINRTRRTVTPAGVREQPIASAEDFAAVLEGLFAIQVPEIGAVWDKAGQASGAAFG